MYFCDGVRKHDLSESLASLYGVQVTCSKTTPAFTYWYVVLCTRYASRCPLSTTYLYVPIYSTKYHLRTCGHLYESNSRRGMTIAKAFACKTPRSYLTLSYTGCLLSRRRILGCTLVPVSADVLSTRGCRPSSHRHGLRLTPMASVEECGVRGYW